MRLFRNFLYTIAALAVCFCINPVNAGVLENNSNFSGDFALDLTGYHSNPANYAPAVLTQKGNHIIIGNQIIPKEFASALNGKEKEYTDDTTLFLPDVSFSYKSKSGSAFFGSVYTGGGGGELNYDSGDRSTQIMSPKFQYGLNAKIQQDHGIPNAYAIDSEELTVSSMVEILKLGWAKQYGKLGISTGFIFAYGQKTMESEFNFKTSLAPLIGAGAEYKSANIKFDQSAFGGTLFAGAGYKLDPNTDMIFNVVGPIYLKYSNDVEEQELAGTQLDRIKSENRADMAPTIDFGIRHYSPEDGFFATAKAHFFISRMAQVDSPIIGGTDDVTAKYKDVGYEVSTTAGYKLLDNKMEVTVTGMYGDPGTDPASTSSEKPDLPFKTIGSGISYDFGKFKTSLGVAKTFYDETKEYDSDNNVVSTLDKKALIYGFNTEINF